MGLELSSMASLPAITWQGGSIRQMKIFPPDGDYGSHRFLWYIDSASIAQERSDFTPLPGYDRWLLTLDREIRLDGVAPEPLSLPPLQSLFFDGEAPVSSQGQTRDFNLLLRRGRCSGTMSSAILSGGQSVQFPRLCSQEFSRYCGLFLCVRGAVRFRTSGGQTGTLAQDQFLSTDETLSLTNGSSDQTPAVLAVAAVCY